ncbi:MAG: hypothetical protein KatS3mg129_0041 [Leptospiraceae bacterium]|nr:MAG: hypothetical protein KatS3mg129_0041 [Leptospiraceae bacterium]
MAEKLTKQEKEEFKEKSAKYKEKIQEIDKEKKMLLSIIKKNPEIAPYAKIRSTIFSIQKASICTDLAILSQIIQNIRGDNYLNDARKEIYGILTDFLSMYDIDFYSSLTDNQEFLEKISEMKPDHRYNFLKALYEITNRIYELELQGKYRWSFPEIYQKLALIVFLFLDFKLLEKTKNPDMPYYDALHKHLELLIEILQKAAQEYRSKYELASKDLDTLQNLKKILELLKRIYNFSGDQNEEQKISFALESTKEKIESLLSKEKKEDKKK